MNSASKLLNMIRPFDTVAAMCSRHRSAECNDEAHVVYVLLCDSSVVGDFVLVVCHSNFRIRRFPFCKSNRTSVPHFEPLGVARIHIQHIQTSCLVSTTSTTTVTIVFSVFTILIAPRILACTIGEETPLQNLASLSQLATVRMLVSRS